MGRAAVTEPPRLTLRHNSTPSQESPSSKARPLPMWLFRTQVPPISVSIVHTSMVSLGSNQVVSQPLTQKSGGRGNKAQTPSLHFPATESSHMTLLAERRLGAT